MPRTNNTKLKILYKDMYQHTNSDCRANCKSKFSCCNEAHCEAAIEWALKRWGIKLEPVGTTIPLLGPNGCIAEPHLRPLCTIHTCDISAFGHKRGDEEWTDKYWQIRDKLEELETFIV